jgi:hypothetical protein
MGARLGVGLRWSIAGQPPHHLSESFDGWPGDGATVGGRGSPPPRLQAAIAQQLVWLGTGVVDGLVLVSPS